MEALNIFLKLAINYTVLMRRVCFSITRKTIKQNEQMNEKEKEILLTFKHKRLF